MAKDNGGKRAAKSKRKPADAAPAPAQAEAAIPAGSEWAGSLGVVVDAGNANRVAGYRLLAFYP